MTTDICRESEFRNQLKKMTPPRVCNFKGGYNDTIQPAFMNYIRSFIEEKFKCFSSEFHQETYQIGADILKEHIHDCFMPYRHLKHLPNLQSMGACSPEHVHLDYLLDTVEELKHEISIMKSEKAEESAIFCLQNDHLMTMINGLKREVDTLKAVISGKGDVVNAVMVINRYWRKYLLLKNVKKFARMYETELLIEYRKLLAARTTLVVKPSFDKSALLSAVESRVKPPTTVDKSNPKNWSDIKAASIASDWNS
jgi:hypothetical protein